MKTTTLSRTNVEAHAGAVYPRALTRHTVYLIGTLAFNAALLLAGVRLTGFAWQDLCLLLLPPMVASAGAGFAFLVLNRMALQSVGPAGAVSLGPLSVPQTWVKGARAQ
ncbi:MAG: hypothetical protein ACLP4W_04455 [Mycobacterium sp.]|uniref:hypothetical protein n=1 Tax=Mycobacterium sp. TaxID=1785 RepID=UPI003F9988EB